MTERTDDEKRQAVLFAARHEYSQQRFELVGTDELWTGDPFDVPLPNGVEPVLPVQRRWDYWRTVLPDSWGAVQVDAYQLKHWCGGFALWCLRAAGLADGVSWIDSKGFCEPCKLPHTRQPKPGDIAWFLKNQHYAIVEAVRGNVVDTIDGNQGLSPGRPAIKMHVGRPISSVAIFYSIQPFVEEAQ